MTDFDRSYITYVVCGFLTVYIFVLLWYTLSFIVTYSPSRAMTENELNLSGTLCGIPLHVAL